MKQFQRQIEDFTCKHCGLSVSGNGYTNHCPRCLWSLHVDVNPGDRQHPCGGLMKPVGIELRGAETIIDHRCTRCGSTRRNVAAASDDRDTIIELSSRPR